jgi:hypothetical protein
MNSCEKTVTPMGDGSAAAVCEKQLCHEAVK